MTIEEVKKAYETTYFCQVHKWGHQLTLEEAQELGLLSATAKPVKPVKPRRTVEKNNNKEE